MSIKPEELRIGNWVQYIDRKDFIKVSQICNPSNDKFKLIYAEGEHLMGSFPFSEIEPIPLTPELLEKCGFYWSVYHQAFHFGDMTMNEFYDLNECYPSGYQLSTFKKKELIGNSFQYLHQLMNIFYSLTNSELIIQL